MLEWHTKSHPGSSSGQHFPSVFCLTLTSSLFCLELLTCMYFFCQSIFKPSLLTFSAFFMTTVASHDNCPFQSTILQIAPVAGLFPTTKFEIILLCIHEGLQKNLLTAKLPCCPCETRGLRLGVLRQLYWRSEKSHQNRQKTLNL